MVQGHIADMAVEIDAAALLVYRAAWVKDMGAARVTREAAMAKLYATESAQRVIDTAVQIHGGDGVRVGHPVEALYREIRALRIYEGASDVQKIVIARSLLSSVRRSLTWLETPSLARPRMSIPLARDNLPPFDQWPDILLDRPEFQYPERLNAAVELTDRMVERGFGDHIALIGNGRRRTYKELADWSNRLAHALVENYGVKPGNRILIRSGNNPALVAAWLAATKAGAVVVNTMPMLRAGELGKIVDKAEIALALTDSRIADELVACAKVSKFLKQVVNFDGTSNHDAELDRVALDKPVKFDAVATGRDDVALLGFTSGTTGEPKATMHFHRDLLIVADGYAKEVLNVTPEDVFVGSPPLAFTFGLGGLAIFPLRFGATATLLENASPANMVQIIETYKATISFTAPTAYRAMMAAMDKGANLSSLRIAVSAGETLPAPVFEDWTRRTGKPILDGIGSTEMLHIFITSRVGDALPGATGRPVAGYEAKVVDANMNDVPVGTVGRLAVRGPTGCRYLSDRRQKDYVIDGWNLTGDAFVRDRRWTFSFRSAQ